MTSDGSPCTTHHTGTGRRAGSSSKCTVSHERAVGSVSGGCVEGAVFELGQQGLADDTPVLQRYGVSDDVAFEVGITCGGIIDVFIETVDPVSFPELDEVATSVAHKEPVAVATVVAHPDPARVGPRVVVWPDRHSGTFGSASADEAVIEDGLADRAGSRRPHPGGDHGVHRRRVDLAALGGSATRLAALDGPIHGAHPIAEPGPAKA